MKITLEEFEDKYVPLSLVFIGILLGLAMGCGPDVPIAKTESGYGKYRVEIIDGCQYFAYGWTLAHKGG